MTSYSLIENPCDGPRNNSVEIYLPWGAIQQLASQGEFGILMAHDIGTTVRDMTPVANKLLQQTRQAASEINNRLGELCKQIERTLPYMGNGHWDGRRICNCLNTTADDLNRLASLANELSANYCNCRLIDA